VAWFNKTTACAWHVVKCVVVVIASCVVCSRMDGSPKQSVLTFVKRVATYAPYIIIDR
jgi:hypothetical protein